MNERRIYKFCAKCGEAKQPDTGYVHDACKGPGRYRFCAYCGVAWGYEAWDYVCLTDLAAYGKPPGAPARVGR